MEELSSKTAIVDGACGHAECIAGAKLGNKSSIVSGKVCCMLSKGYLNATVLIMHDSSASLRPLRVPKLLQIPTASRECYEDPKILE